MEYKTILAVIAIIIGLSGYVPYFRDIFASKTKPHAFSWLVWAILTGIAFAGQAVGKGGAGAWVTGFTALVSISIFFLALSKGTKKFPLADWLCLAGCGLALILWAITNNPLTAIILITLIDFVAFIPTFRKSYINPYSETVFTYTMSGLKFLISIIALQKYSAVTILYPASLVLTNFAFILMAATRRKSIKSSPRIN